MRLSTRTMRFEGLEPRQMMAADIDLNRGVLEVTGTNNRDIIQVQFGGNSDSRVIATVADANGRVLKQEDFSRSSVKSLMIKSLGGDDNVVNFTTIQSTMLGGTGNDGLYAFAGINQLSGQDGDDILVGGSGNDTLIGGNGNDRASGRAGNDYFRGDEGNDDLRGGLGNDVFYGGNGNDAIRGDKGDDFAWGEAGNDILNGGDGNDRLMGGVGNDAIYCGAGDDIASGEAGQDYLFGSFGNDQLTGGADDDWLYGDAGADRLSGDDGNDFLYGGLDFDVLQGGTGADRLDGGYDGYADEMWGNSGSDTFVQYKKSYGFFTVLEQESRKDYVAPSGGHGSFGGGFGGWWLSDKVETVNA